jgi:hypothetical protein
MLVLEGLPDRAVRVGIGKVNADEVVDMVQY